MPFYLTEYNRNTNTAVYWDLSTATIRAYPNGAVGYGFWPPSVNTQFATIPVANPPDPNAAPQLSGLPTSPTELQELIEDRVAALIIAGAGITKVYDDPAGSLTLSAAAGGGIKIINSIRDLATEPGTTGIVYCKQYWQGATAPGEPGLFVWVDAITTNIDNGLVFKGMTASGRWLRYGRVTPLITDFGAVGVKTPYSPDVSFAISGAPQTLLSEKFTTLADAQAWYPTSSIAALTESLNSAAIQQAHIYSSALIIPEGAYWLNRSIEYTRDRSIQGISRSGSTLLFDAIAGAGFKPKSNNNNVALNNANMKFLILKSFGMYSNAMPYDPATGAVTANSVVFDETKSGFYLPKRAAAAEAQLGNPLVQDSVFDDLIIQRFAGHGFFFGNIFSTLVTNVKADQCKGWGYRYYGSVGCKFENSYVGRFNGLGGYWLENPGDCVGLNGVDTQGTYLLWGQIGDPADANVAVNGTFVNCNFEGCRDALAIYGNATKIDFQRCIWQWWLTPTAGTQQNTDKARPTIRCYGAGGSIKFDDTCYFSYAVGSALIAPDQFLWVNGNGWDVDVRAKCYFGGAALKWMVVDASGADGIFGIGFANAFILKHIRNVFLTSAGSLYAKYWKIFSRVSVEQLAIGFDQETATAGVFATTFVTIVTGTGAPIGAANGAHRLPKGSLYIRQDGANANEVIYVCTNYDSATAVSTWVAK